LKTFGIYTLIVVACYFSGLGFYEVAQHLLSIPEESEYHLLYPWMSIFFIFFALPFYFIITLVFNRFKSRSISKINATLKTIVLIVFGALTSLLVPFMFGGFGYIANPMFFLSELGILLSSFFIGTALVFSICTSLAKQYLNRLK
jgi:hypothetical protein